MSKSRVCPFCMVSSYIKKDDYQSTTIDYKDENNNLFSAVFNVIPCPNPSCKKVEINMEKSIIHHTALKFPYSELLIEPSNETALKDLPTYIPKAIKEDYREAQLIASLSPKASATLSRRCLQSMIRDFHGITNKKTLHAEIEAIKDKIDHDVYSAIMGLKSIGNLGAHPEKDINLIIDIEPIEAQELIGLIEILIDDWYIARHNKQERLTKIKALSVEKNNKKEFPKSSLPLQPESLNHSDQGYESHE
ncbi:hypothetical protein B9T10_02230 [Wohlfahrtiimonas chitiniclastica]|uniref:DUF4145 domain-containing protein n=1 Tax=Wohlfahrtiimonas chitiniclastica TaxID=400946 RepID=UPI000B982EB3|nr:DUF4145 domain-containing protein [Wohlfahrtiimonas chitiniclastica]OYQ90159.1 hypothetical protein B9T10_02230 [Wohlfahrtiimonas chitiniclastica]